MGPRMAIHIPRILTPVLLWGLLVLPAFAYMLPFTPFPKLDVSGSNTYSYTLSQVTGSQSYYHDDNLGLNGMAGQSSNLLLTGELYKNLFVNAEVTSNSSTNDNFRWNLLYRGTYEKVTLGDFTANLAGNDFVSLNRSLLGVQVDTVLPRGTFSFLTSQLESPVHTDNFYGKNISGPYYLTASPIVDGSDVVLVNDQKKDRTKDYTLDYTNGILNFNGGLIVGPADRVTVSYEVMVSNGAGGGRLYAVRGTYPLLDTFNVGFTHLLLTQQGQGGSSTVSERDQYLGNNTPGPFLLTYRPVVAGSDQVTVNGVLETAYTLDDATGQLLFNSGYLPPVDATIIVRYNVANVTNTVAGDQSVSGVDMAWGQPGGLKLTFQAAQSTGASSTAQNGNMAFEYGAGFARNNLAADVHFRQVDPGFTPLDAVGYRSVLQDLEWNAKYSPVPMLAFSTSGGNTHEPVDPYNMTDQNAAGSATTGTTEEHTRSFGIDFRPTGWPVLSLRRTLYQTDDSLTSDASNATVTDTLSLAWTHRALTAKLGLNHVDTDSAQLTDPTDPSTLFHYHSGTDGATMNVQFQPSDRWDIGTNLANNRTTSTDTSGTNRVNAESMQVTGHFRATSKLIFTTNFTDNRTGNAVNLDGSAIAGQTTSNMMFGVDWRPWTNLGLGVSYANNRSQGGDDSTNSVTNSYSANVNWQPRKLVSLNSYWTRQDLQYLTGEGNSLSTMVGANTDLGPFGRFKVTLDGQHLWGQTAVAVATLSTQFANAPRILMDPLASPADTTVNGNALTSMRAKVSYAITKRQNLFVSGDFTTNAGFPSVSYKQSAALGWDFQLNDNMTVTLNAGRVSYVDQANPSLNYTANQLSSQCSWHF